MWFIQNSKLLTLMLFKIDKRWIGTLVLKTGQWTYNELKEIKDYKSPYQQKERQADKHTDNLPYLKSMG